MLIGKTLNFLLKTMVTQRGKTLLDELINYYEMDCYVCRNMDVYHSSTLTS